MEFYHDGEDGRWLGGVREGQSWQGWGHQSRHLDGNLGYLVAVAEDWGFLGWLRGLPLVSRQCGATMEGNEQVNGVILFSIVKQLFWRMNWRWLKFGAVRTSGQ